MPCPGDRVERFRFPNSGAPRRPCPSSVIFAGEPLGARAHAPAVRDHSIGRKPVLPSEAGAMRVLVTGGADHHGPPGPPLCEVHACRRGGFTSSASFALSDPLSTTRAIDGRFLFIKRRTNYIAGGRAADYVRPAASPPLPIDYLSADPDAQGGRAGNPQGARARQGPEGRSSGLHLRSTGSAGTPREDCSQPGGPRGSMTRRSASPRPGDGLPPLSGVDARSSSSTLRPRMLATTDSGRPPSARRCGRPRWGTVPTDLTYVSDLVGSGLMGARQQPININPREMTLRAGQDHFRLSGSEIVFTLPVDTRMRARTSPVRRLFG